MNIANRLTILRIIFTFVFIFFLSFPFAGIWSLVAKAISLTLFIFVALTDFLDGRIARKRNMVTDFGKLMDPIADKIFVLSAFAAFVQIQLIPAWMFVIVMSREIVIMSLRLFALNKGKVLSAGKSGKHKTFSQMAVIFLILVFIVVKEVMLTFFTWNPIWEKLFTRGVFFVMLFVAVLTLTSGLSYLWENRKIIISI